MNSRYQKAGPERCDIEDLCLRGLSILLLPVVTVLSLSLSLYYQSYFALNISPRVKAEQDAHATLLAGPDQMASYYDLDAILTDSQVCNRHDTT
jgi:hypothetical protein